MDMTKLTDKQRHVMLMRYTYGWRLARIAVRMGTTRQAVHDMLQRAHLRLGFPRLASRKPWLPKPRRRQRKPLYLSELPQDIANNLCGPGKERRNIDESRAQSRAKSRGIQIRPPVGASPLSRRSTGRG
ncbi:MAG TPA: sigma factor-like helix-turn-helix DNA-binding protein [Humisphaera sp.]|nr:sigma factor-like helix-turn-helix DNA-binding protein [Humisphaera sp.]